MYLSLDPESISRVLQNPKQTGDLRLFLGRAQWVPEQLQGEARRGSWYSLRAEGNVIFDSNSDRLWERMHERARPPSRVENRLPRPSCGRDRVAATGTLPYLWPVFTIPALTAGGDVTTMN
ncbi:MAG: YqgE/AlgH family protein [Terriglobia bacterium]